DLPVDPNEPVYCLCMQVSYGKMVGCDNPSFYMVCSPIHVLIRRCSCMCAAVAHDDGRQTLPRALLTLFVSLLFASWEWFHFGCVNLTKRPPGRWLCPGCTAQRRQSR
ncbi:unnamed protein product, partial [Ectocarpus sp. 12 AP-2014]